GETCLALLAEHQQAGDLTGGTRGHLAAIEGIGQWLGARQLPERQGRRCLPRDLPALLAPTRLDARERQRIVRTLAEEEGALPFAARLGLLEQPVDRIDHRLAGAEVGV